MTLSLPLSWFLGRDLVVVDSCDPQSTFMRMMNPVRSLVSIGLWVAVLAPLAWWVWRQYAPGSQGTA